LLSLIRSGALGNQQDIYVQLNRLNKPVLCIRGTKDKILTKLQMDRIMKLMPCASVQEIPDTGHPLLLTHPELVAPYLLQFLGKHIQF